MKTFLFTTILLAFLSFQGLIAQDQKTNRAETETQFSNWLRGYIPEKYPGSTFDHHGDWYQIFIPEYALTVSWGFVPQTKCALKDLEGLSEHKSIFIAKETNDWPNNSKIDYSPNVGYLISEYASSTMGDFNVGLLTVIQFDGKPEKFMSKMVKAYGENPDKSELEFMHWLKDYMNVTFPALKVAYHGAWYQSVIPLLDLTVTWGTMSKAKMTLKELHGVRENKSIFIEKNTNDGWERFPTIDYTEGAGYYISKYTSSSMGDMDIGKCCVVQFDGGDADIFSVTMTKAWTKAWQAIFDTGKHGMYKPRVINTTDLGADPDDKQSMVRQLVCANEFEIEGLIVATGCWRKQQSNTDMLDKIVNAYGKVYPNLRIHADGYPSPEYLKSISLMGQLGYGMRDVGTGKDSPGSDLVIKAVDKDDPRPVWVMGWGGMNIAAQAIWKVRETRSPEELDQFLSKLRLFDILGQDDAGAWIVKNFPEVFYIRATGVYGWAPSDEYLDTHIQNHGPLGAAYPDRKWATEGDSPAFMHVYPNGLNDPEQIDQGGWGGRFSFIKKEGIRSMSEVKKINADAELKYDPYYMYGNTPEKAKAIKKWSKGYDNDFAARMDWSMTCNYKEANHHPTAVLNGDYSRQVLKITARPGSTITLKAADSSDPDGDSLFYSWSFYDAPSSYDGSVTIQHDSSPLAKLEIPEDAVDKNIHIILEIHDSGTPNLYAYRRLIVQIQASQSPLQNEKKLTKIVYFPNPDKVLIR